MNRAVILNQKKSRRGRNRVKREPGRVEAFPPQERFSGPVPLRGERPAAELLRERMAEAGSIPQVFVP